MREKFSVVLLLSAAILGACNRSEPVAAVQKPHLTPELVFYDWAEDMPQSVLDAFTAETGVKVTYLTYESMEEAVEKIRTGQVAPDVAVLDNDFVATLREQDLLAEIDFRNVSNFKNVSPNFRDLAVDPGNRHSVPYHYGTTGLLVRTDLVGDTVKRWADLWKPRYAGKVALRDQPREVLALTLLSLGCALNSEDPKELKQALERLLAVEKPFVLLGVEASSAVPELLSGRVVVLQGWAEDYRVAAQQNKAVRYVVPEDATTLWSDSYTIPARSARKETAEVFLNYLLRPEVSARIVNEKKYATANDASLPLIAPELRNDRVLFPPMEVLRRAHVYTTLSEKGEKLYDDVWKRFKSATQGRGGGRRGG
ncbi:MAG: spermidine/putrescine ABC transporter substrate-binding protein [Deltaproteobacteria bacterium]|nr:spermidine/putrescine ABC transporter substrate-binding protein [Deltaproteobacteria bacterium]